MVMNGCTAETTMLPVNQLLFKILKIDATQDHTTLIKTFEETINHHATLADCQLGQVQLRPQSIGIVIHQPGVAMLCWQGVSSNNPAKRNQRIDRLMKHRCVMRLVRLRA